jgi:hypothetical protein
MVLINAIFIIVFVTTQGAADGMVLSYSIIYEGGAVLSNNYCNNGSIWLTWIILIGNCLWFIPSLLSCTTLYAGWNADNVRYKYRGIQLLQHQQLFRQIISIAAAELVLVVTAAALIITTWLTSLQYDNKNLVVVQSIIILVGVLGVVVVWIVPSLHLARKIATGTAGQRNTNQKLKPGNYVTLDSDQDGDRMDDRSTIHSSTINSSATSTSHSDSFDLHGLDTTSLELNTLHGALTDPVSVLLLQEHANAAFEGENVLFLVNVKGYIKGLRIAKSSRKELKTKIVTERKQIEHQVLANGQYVHDELPTSSLAGSKKHLSVMDFSVALAPFPLPPPTSPDFVSIGDIINRARELFARFVVENAPDQVNAVENTVELLYSDHSV